MRSTQGYRALLKTFHTFLCLFCLAASLVFGAHTGLARAEPASLVIAASEDSPPLSFRDDTGQPAGLLVDYWSLWSRKTGQKISFLLAPFSETFVDVRSGRAQLHSGCFKSPGREEYLEYLDPFHTLRTDIFSQDSLRPRTLKELLGFQVGVVKGDYAVDYLKRLVPGVAFRIFPGYDALFSSLGRGELKIFVADRPVGVSFLKRLGRSYKYTYEVNAPLYTREVFAAVRKGNDALARTVRAGMAAITPEERAALEEKWAGSKTRKTENLLRIACPIDFAPFAMRTITGEPAGMQVDLWRMWARKVGVKVAFSFSGWAESVRSVVEGENDFHCGMLPTKSYSELVFGPPNFPVNINLFAPSGAEPPALERLSGKKVAVLKSSQQETWLRGNAPGLALSLFDDTQSLLASVVQKKTAALCNSQANTMALLERNALTNQLQTSKAPLYHDYLCPALLAARSDLMKLLQFGFEKISNRELLAVEQRWIPNPQQRLFSAYGRKVLFSEQELRRIKDLPLLRLGIHTDHPPLEFVSKKKEYKGIIPEVLRLLEKRFSIRFEPQLGLDWNATLLGARKGTIDVLSELPEGADNHKDFVFTKSYFEYPLVVVTRSDYPFFPGLSALEGKTMAVPYDDELEAYLRKNYPEISLDVVREYATALKKVSDGRVDSCIGDMLALPYLTNKLHIENVKIALHTDRVTKIHMAVPRAQKKLAGLLDKMLSTIPRKQQEKIAESWVMARFEPTTDWGFVWKVGLSVAAASGILLLVILLWNRRLAREIAHRRTIEERLSSIAANVPGAIFQAYIRPDGNFGYYYVSKRCEEFFGFTEEEAKTDPGVLRIASEDAERFFSSFKQAGREFVDWNFTGRIWHPDGSLKWVNAIAKPVRGNDGEAVFNGILLDITERKLVAQKYLEAEKKIRAMSEATHDALMMIDSHGIVQFWNPASEKIFGIPADEALGRELQILFPASASRDYVSNKILTFLVNEKQLASGGELQETLARKRHGAEFPVDLALNPFEVEGVRYVVATVRDISTRKEAEARIKDQLMFSSALIDTIPNPIFIMDTDARYLGCNRAYESAFGVSRDAVIGKDSLEVEHFPEQLRTMLYGEERIALTERAIRHHELKAPYADGQEHTLLYWCTTFNLSDGRLAGLINVMVDITAQKQVERDLHILSQAVECSPVSMLLLDRGGNIEYANPTFYQRLSLERAEVDGATYASFFSSQNSPGVLASLRETIERGGNWQGDLASETKPGESIWESAWFSPIINAEGAISHYVVMKEDITGRKKMEHELIEAKETAEAATKAKSEFLARMSHEIRTPMNAIMGMAHLALQTELDDKQLDYIKKIQLSATALLNIINDILDFSKIEAGKMRLEAIEFRLEGVLDSLASLLSFKAGEKGLELLFNLDPEVPEILIGDPLRLNQVLINLANNAVKFTEQGEIVVATQLTRRDDERVTITFSVQDTGIGLSKEHQGHLFQSFSQADGSTTRKFGGTGLGLAISKRLVEMMEGNIWVESQEGQGSTFSFTSVFGYRDALDEHSLLLPSVKLRQLRTLVVDDNPLARNILKHTLQSFTFQVVTADSGHEALLLLEGAPAENPFQLVLMDMSMPGMNGVETTEKIKNSQKLQVVPKVILFTSYSGEEASQGNVSVGFDGILVKPASRSLLFNTIMEAFGHGRGRFSSENESSQGDALLRARERLSGARALLVEDNDINQEIAVELIEQAGLLVDVADNGLEAIRAASATDYDIILMDIQMPEMDGLEAAGMIRRQNTPWAKDVPILAMTADAMEGDREKSFAAGMSAHIVKPIDPDELYEALLRWTRLPAVSGTAEGPLEKAPAGALPVTGDLPGLSVRMGLKRVGNNKRLYADLLQRFRAGNADVISRFKKALKGNDVREAAQLAHTLKGVSGNLGAMELFQAAEAFENALQAGAADGLDGELDALESRLQQVMEAVNILEPMEQQAVAPSFGAPPDSEAVFDILDSFERLLEEDISEALDCVRELQPLVLGGAFESYYKAILSCLDMFDSDAALVKSRELRAALKGADAEAKDASGEAPEEDDAVAATVPTALVEKIAPLVREMADFLEKDLVESLARMPALDDLLHETPCAPLVAVLTENLDNFDTDAAHKILQTIARQLGFPLKMP